MVPLSGQPLSGQPQMPQEQQQKQKQPDGVMIESSPSTQGQNLAPNRGTAKARESKPKTKPQTQQAQQSPTQNNAVGTQGQPTYMSKAGSMNLQLPPARKKAKTSTGSQPAVAASFAASSITTTTAPVVPPVPNHTPAMTNNPQTLGSINPTPQAIISPSAHASKAGSPDMRRSLEVAPPPRPNLTCLDYDCAMFAADFPSESAYKEHMYIEHDKPKVDPIKFAQEQLEAALGISDVGIADGKDAVEGDKKELKWQQNNERVEMTMEQLIKIDSDNLFFSMSYETHGTRRIDDVFVVQQSTATPQETPELSKELSHASSSSSIVDPILDMHGADPFDIDVVIDPLLITEADFSGPDFVSNELAPSHRFPEEMDTDAPDWDTTSKVTVDPSLFEDSDISHVAFWSL
jgi:hypothetical protein